MRTRMRVQFDDLKKLNKSSRGAVYAAFLLIGVFALYSWIMAPHVGYLRAVHKYEPVLGTLQEQRKEMQAYLTTRHQMLERLNADFAQIRRQLFNYEEARTFFDGLQSMAAAQQCHVTNIDMVGRLPIMAYEDQTGDLVMEGVEATLVFVGSYDAIISFIKHIEALEKKVWIDWLHLEVSETHEDQLQCNMAVTVYIVQEKEAASDD